MLTKNINFKNFYSKKSNFKNKKLLNKIKKKNYFDQFKILNTLKPNYTYSFNKKKIKKFKSFNSFRVIGMGGSILGIEAIHQFLKPKIKKNFSFINNLQSSIPSENKKSKTLNIIISKSGNTLETIVNSNVLLKVQKKNNLFITEKNNSYLFNLAKKIKADIIEHKNYIGGRYSVLSEVGMLPAELMGLNEKKFKRYNYLIRNNKFLNLLIENVSSILKLNSEKKFNSIILNYDKDSENIFKWYQQLVAESLGKKSKGILPIISTMPKDNHSLLQLYLDGPKYNFYTFFNVKEKNTNYLDNKYILKSKSYLKDASLLKVFNSQRLATERVFKKKKLPFRKIELLNRNEETLGELFSFFILETILLGKALKINPFDQPSVELIKNETKRILV